MKRIAVVAVVCVAVIVLAGIQNGFFSEDSQHVENSGGTRSTTVTNDSSENARESLNTTVGQESTIGDGGGNKTALSNIDPSLEAFLQFEEDSAGLVAEIESLNEAERNDRLDEYLREVERFEAEGRFMAPEVMLLKAQVLKLRQLPEHVVEERQSALIDEYRVKSEQVQRELAENPSQELVTYKIEAQRIAQEIAEMPNGAFADEAARNNYLRERLQRARIEIYSKKQQE